MKSVCFLPIIENPHLSTICLGFLLVMRKTQLIRIEYACSELVYQNHHICVLCSHQLTHTFAPKKE